MSKRKESEDKSAVPSGDVAAAPSTAVEVKSIEPMFDVANVDLPKIDKIDVVTPDAPKVDAPKVDQIKPLMAEDAALPPIKPVAAPAAARIDAAVPAQPSRFAFLAASVAIAAAVGATGGAFGASGLARLWPAPVEAAPAPTASEETRALQKTIAQLRTEFAALRTSVEAGTKSTNGQFAKFTERFDRVERAQAEPAARITKAVEALERMERRTDVVPAKETTGSVTQPQPVVASAPVQPQSPVVDGWIVRGVYRGAAIIQGRRLGMMEVEPGDVVPGVGRVEAIRKQDGRWVVVTAKGLITSAR